MKTKIKRIIIPLLFIVFFIVFLFFPSNNYIYKQVEGSNVNIIGKLSNKDVVIQEFVSDNNYDAFGFKFANYSQMIFKGNLEIVIKDKTTNKTTVKKVELNEQQDNSYIYVNYNLKKKHNYEIEIKNNSNKEITFYTARDKNDKTKLYLNDDFQKSDLQMTFRYKEKKYSFIWYYLMALFLYLTYVVLNVGDKK